MENIKYVAVAKEQMNDLRDYINSTYIYGQINIELLTAFLNKNCGQILFDLEMATLGRGWNISIPYSLREDLENTTRRVYIKDGIFGDSKPYNLFVDQSSLLLMGDLQGTEPAIDLSKPWIETQVNFYGRDYVDSLKRALVREPQGLKAEHKNAEDKLEFLANLQSGR